MDLPHEARAYAQADFRDVNAAFVERLLELAADRGSALALDLGTGPGDIPKRVLAERPGWRIVGVDGAKAMLDFAREGNDPNLHWIQADALQLPFPGGVFDIVFSNSILHHVRDAIIFWREVRRMCKPGAVVFVRDLRRPESEPAARKLVEEHAAQESALLQDEFHRSLLAAYTAEEVRAQLSAAALDLTVEVISDRHLDAFGGMP